MKRWVLMAGATALAGLMGTTAAVAAVTAQDVWGALKARVTAAGQTISAASEQKTGDVLAVKGITITSKSEGGTVTGLVNEADFTEQPDGSVVITMAPEATVDMHLAPEGEPPSQTQLKLVQSGLKVVVSGEPGNMVYDSTLPSLDISLDGVKRGDKTKPVKFDAKLIGLTNKTTLTGTDGPINVTSNGAADSLTFTLHGEKADDKDSLDVNGNLTGLGTSSVSTMVPTADMKNLGAALKAGVTFEGGFTYKTADIHFVVVDNGKASKGSASASDGKLSMALDKAHLAYDTSAANQQVTFSSPVLPVQNIEVKLAESAVKLLMPVGKSDTPQDFSLVLRLAGLAVNDDVWAMVDPTGALPHDPATLIVDLAGKVKSTFDIFDPEQFKMAKDTPPQLTALTINKVNLAAAGADFSANGAFTFNNADTTTFDGFPAPDGSVDLKLTGGNTLMDKLVKMGLLPKDQVMGFRMMLGAFARPGDGPDTLVSKIEVTPDGHIKANGQQLK